MLQFMLEELRACVVLCFISYYINVRTKAFDLCKVKALAISFSNCIWWTKLESSRFTEVFLWVFLMPWYVTKRVLLSHGEAAEGSVSFTTPRTQPPRAAPRIPRLRLVTDWTQLWREDNGSEIPTWRLSWEECVLRGTNDEKDPTLLHLWA